MMMAWAPEFAHLGEHAAEIDLAFLVIILRQYLAYEVWKIFSGEVDRRAPIVAIDGKNGEFFEAALLSGVFDHDDRRSDSCGTSI